MNYPMFWAILGAIFCLMELFLPTGFVESTLGLSAFIVALVALGVPSFSFQIVVWVTLSLVFIFLLLRFVPKRTPYSLQESTEARTLTAIAPGQTGRVIYEGNSWQARCDDETITVGANQPVVVVRRKGNTLYVIPESALRA
ncbi:MULTISPECIES: NfeD family protein [Cyanophyceae]|uniref:NfeD family protein n=1 Tax=Cyanophyceae TaxID=3028117 RepID=UPI001688BDF6|nr:MULTISPECIES: NfeD family protein [Cyanophyceae]MBD1916007.1 NfeD family protein [Phormidium sp. FACHB-77]MBD2031724.1 NfeD family protein [Phormidium sp. FACHB-322]MBD2052649.1 NfeD family protein [Leptolyngbya sp. FACHB-60]